MIEKILSYHVTTNDTIVVTDQSAYFLWMLLSVTSTGGGTNWTFKVQNKETPPKAIVALTLSSPGNAQDVKGGIFDPPEPIIMMNGIEIVTAAGTPGILDVWITFLTNE